MINWRRNWPLRVTVVAAVTAAVWLFLSSRQPSYQGKSLEQWMDPTNHSVIQAHAIIALGRIRCQPEIVVPAVTPFLRSPDVALRQKAVFALARFGTKSRPARDELVRSLSDTDYWTRFSASNVLKVIDAEKVPDGAAN